MIEKNAKGYYYDRTEGEPDLTVSAGNSKIIGPTFANKEGKEYSCNYNCKGCYAAKPYTRASTVKNCRMNNFEATKKRSFFERMNDILGVMFRDNLSGDYFRINDSGDFTDAGNLNDWVRLAICNPAFQFLAYTKKYMAVHYILSKRILPENFSLVLSIMPDIPLADQYNAINVSESYDLPVAYTDDLNDYSTYIHNKLISRELVDCTFDTCVECSRICWKVKGSDVAIHFYRH